MREGVLLTYPGSNQNVLSDVLALQRAGLLALFCTTIAWQRGRSLIRRLPSGIRQELERRVFEGVDAALIRTFPGRELVHQAARRLGLAALTRHETGWASVDAVSRALDRRVARLVRRGGTHASAVYGYEDASLGTFEAARELGIRRFYELTTGYWQAGLRIMTEERDLSPEWAPTLENLQDSRQKQERKDAELAMADHVIVPSEFVRKTLVEHPGFSASIDIIPYGAPVPRAAVLAVRARPTRLRLLYVGHLSQRKGISYLFDAMRQLQGAATLTLVGQKPGVECPKLDHELRSHDWLGTMPHKRVLEIMGQHDVFIFPSLFEGFGLVILEAMAQGLPVIATSNTAGPELIEDGVDGFVVPIRNAEAIVARVLELSHDRDQLASMSAAALLKAKRMSWIARERRLIDSLRDRMSSHAASGSGTASMRVSA